ncbi:MAG: hypothetical protein NVSMB56_20430 [Pyrinomonadaceae bacterium]
MKLRVLYHGHCFDGVASAALFSRFYRARFQRDADIEYTALLHRPNNLFDDAMFDADENAIVDFKYSPSPRVTWWFDHHQSAFLSTADEANFNADTSGKKFLDTTSKSCCEFIARVAREKFDYEDATLQPLINWAHIIDGALYDSPAQAVELRAPALQLMQVIESVPENEFIENIIRELTTKTLDEVALSDEVQRAFQPIYEQHIQTLEAIKRKAAYTEGAQGVVVFDLVEEGFEGFNKFIPYYLFPNATYTVAVTRSPQRAKISVGSNPWSQRPRTHNIATICERYGGGGHAVVGAVSLKPDEIEKARKAASEIVSELSK